MKKIPLIILFFTSFCYFAKCQDTSIDNLPEKVKEVIQKEFPGYEIQKIKIPDQKFYFIVFKSRNNERWALATLPDGTWLKKTLYVNLTEVQLGIVMQVQESVDVYQAKNWLKSIFADGTIEYRVDIKGQQHAWDKDFQYLGIPKSRDYPYGKSPEEK